MLRITGDSGLTWKQPRRRIYEAYVPTGSYVLTAQTGDLRRCRLYFFKNGRSIEVQPDYLGKGRVSDLMRIAEMHNAQNP